MMFDHVGIVVAELRRSVILYRAMLEPLGIHVTERHILGPNNGWVVMSSGEPHAPFLVIGAGRPSFWGSKARVSASPIHLAFRAATKEAVDRFYAAGLEGGARDNGGPDTPRHPWYGAFLIDFDGNNVEARAKLD